MKRTALSLLVLMASGAYVWSAWDGTANDDPLGLAPQAEAAPVDDFTTGSIARREPVRDEVSADAPAPLPPAPADQTTVIAEKGPRGAWPSASPAEASPAEPPTSYGPADALASTQPPEQQTSEQPVFVHPLKVETVPFRLPAEPDAAVAAPPQTPEPAAPPQPALIEARLPRPRPDYRPPAASATVAPTVMPVSMTVAANGRYADGIYTGPAVSAYWGMIQIQAIVQSGRLVGIKVLQYPSDRRTSVRINRVALPMLRDEVVQAQSTNVDIISGATLTSEAFIRSLGSALRQATA